MIPFFSLMFVLPTLAIISYFTIILSFQKSITESMMDSYQHKNYAALLCAGGTFALNVAGLDILAALTLNYEFATDVNLKIMYGNHTLYVTLCISLVLEWIIIFLFDLLIILLLSIYVCVRRNYDVKQHENLYFWTFIVQFIPPIWCLASHSGFILTAWNARVRQSTSLTLVYILLALISFLFMRQMYAFIADRIHKHNTDSMKREGISIKIIILLRFVGVLLVLLLSFVWYGLLQLPITEFVDAPIQLYNTLQLVMLAIAGLISYNIFKARNITERGTNYNPIC